MARDPMKCPVTEEEFKAALRARGFEIITLPDGREVVKGLRFKTSAELILDQRPPPPPRK